MKYYNFLLLTILIIFQQYFHFSELRYFCHFHILSSYLTWSAQFDRFVYFVQNILLANKDQEDEEASEKVEAINNSEEDLKVDWVIITRSVTVVTMEEIMETREGPEDAENREQLAEEYLQTQEHLDNLKCVLALA